MGLTLSGLVVVALPVAALDAEDVLNYRWGKLTVKPQLDITSVFTDNVFYGNNSILAALPASPTEYLSTNAVAVSIGGTNNFILRGPGPDSGTLVTNGLPVISRSAEHDVLMTISPGARFAYGYSDANHFSLEYTFDKIFYTEHPQYNTDQQSFLFDTSLAASHWKLKGSDQMRFLSSFLGGGYFSTAAQQVNRREWVDDYRFDYEISPKTYAYVEGNHYNQDYDKGLNIYDADTLRGSLGGGYNLSDLVSVFLEGYYGQTAVAPNIDTQPKGPHSTVIGGFVGLKGDFTARITGSVKVGYETRMFPESAGGGSSSASSPAVEVKLTYAPSLKTQLSLSYSRRTDVSQQFVRQALTYDNIGLTALQTIGTSGRWFVQFAANYTSTETGDLQSQFFVRDLNASGVPNNFVEVPDYATGNVYLVEQYKAVTGNIGRTDTQITIGPTLVYQPRPWLQASLGYQFTHFSSSYRDAQYASTHPLIPYDANEVTLRVSIGF